MTVPRIATTTPIGPVHAPLLVVGCSLGTSALLWHKSAEILSSDFRVSTWELPGHGASPATREGFSVADLADAVAASYTEKFAYAGVSLGGAVGLELALRHPQRVSAVVTVCSAARFAEPQAWHERAQTVRASGTGAVVAQSAQRWFAPDTMARFPDVAGRLLHALRDADDESYALCCDALAEFDMRGLLSTIAVPVTAAFGAHDAVTPEEASREIADGVTNGRVIEIAGASHLAPADSPEPTAVAVRNALAGQGLEGMTHEHS